MSLQEIVNVTITKDTAAVTRAGFGVPMVLSYFTQFAERTRTYTSLDGLAADGFGTSNFAYKAMQAIFSQNPKVTSVVLGRRALPAQRIVRLVPVSPVKNSTLYNVTINDITAPFTSDATATVAEVVAGVVAAIQGPAVWLTLTPYVIGDVRQNFGNVYIVTVAGTSGATGPSGTGTAIVDGSVTWSFVRETVVPPIWLTTTAYVVGDRRKLNGNVYEVTVAGTSGATGPSGTLQAFIDGTVTWRFTGPTVTATDVASTSILITQDAAGPSFVLEVERQQLTQTDESLDPGIVTDLTAVRTDTLSGNDTWYALAIDSHSETEIKAVAAAIEALRKIFIDSNADDSTLTGSTTDVFSDLRLAAYARTASMYHPKPHTFPEAAWLGKVLPNDPGSETWKFKTLAGIEAVKLSSTEQTNLNFKKANHYQTIAGVNITAEGTTASGEFIDITRFIDALTADIEEHVFARLASLVKVPFTDAGIAIIETEVRASLLRGIASGGLVSDPAPTVTVPRAVDVDSADKNDRILRHVVFNAVLAGAIHNVVINGHLTV